MQGLPGFRDFLPNECAARNYIFAKWREVARRYGFVEWDGPVLESTELYKKKSGDEIVGQLFSFTDKGEREVALRPELTPTLARVIAVHEREFKKPLKWFSIGPFFRYEKQQRGRLREHFQLNCDIVGEASQEADAELIALCIDTLRSFGFTEEDFVVRISDRRAWVDYLSSQKVDLSGGKLDRILSVIDKLGRGDRSTLDKQLQTLGTSLTQVEQLITFPEDYFEGFQILRSGLVSRGLGRYVRITPGIVRGLTYYTGFVFEVFDGKEKLRAIAGGGRYDNLIEQLSEGAVKMPALGFAMGDVVLGELIGEHPAARAQMEAAMRDQRKIDIYVVIAKEEHRADALAQIQQLRENGYRVDYPLAPAKVPKQFQTAEDLGATVALLYGDEWPNVKVKTLATREEGLIAQDQLLSHIAEIFSRSS
jgi:histidyl-tRNA synthetase